MKTREPFGTLPVVSSGRRHPTVAGSDPYGDAAPPVAITVEIVAPQLAAGSVGISGTPAVGQTLTATTGGWAPSTSFSYRWFVDGVEVAGAAGPTFTVERADAGHAISGGNTGGGQGGAPSSSGAGSTPKSGGPGAGARPKPPAILGATYESGTLLLKLSPDAKGTLNPAATGKLKRSTQTLTITLTFQPVGGKAVTETKTLRIK